MSFPKDEKIAALICIVFEIPYEHAKLMAADQVNSLIEWHHCVIPKAEGGPDVHWNAQPMLRGAHRGRTAKIDVPRIAKGKRIRATERAHKLVRSIGAERREPKRKWNWPQGRKLQSRGFERSKR
jgi:hypothetical protein